MKQQIHLQFGFVVGSLVLTKGNVQFNLQWGAKSETITGKGKTISMKERLQYDKRVMVHFQENAWCDEELSNGVLGQIHVLLEAKGKGSHASCAGLAYRSYSVECAVLQTPALPNCALRYGTDPSYETLSQTSLPVNEPSPLSSLEEAAAEIPHFLNTLTAISSFSDSSSRASPTHFVSKTRLSPAVICTCLSSPACAVLQ